MSRIIKIGHIEALIDYPEDVVNTHWDLAEEKIKNNYGKGWRLPTVEELLYIKDLSLEFGIFSDFNVDDDYWTSKSGEPGYIPDRNEFDEDFRWFYQVRMPNNKHLRGSEDSQKEFLCHVDYYGNILPVRDI